MPRHAPPKYRHSTRHPALHPNEPHAPWHVKHRQQPSTHTPGPGGGQGDKPRNATRHKRTDAGKRNTRPEPPKPPNPTRVYERKGTHRRSREPAPRGWPGGLGSRRCFTRHGRRGPNAGSSGCQWSRARDDELRCLDAGPAQHAGYEPSGSAAMGHGCTGRRTGRASRRLRSERPGRMYAIAHIFKDPMSGLRGPRTPHGKSRPSCPCVSLVSAVSSRGFGELGGEALGLVGRFGGLGGGFGF